MNFMLTALARCQSRGSHCCLQEVCGCLVRSTPGDTAQGPHPVTMLNSLCQGEQEQYLVHRGLNHWNRRVWVPCAVIQDLNQGVQRQPNEAHNYHGMVVKVLHRANDEDLKGVENVVQPFGCIIIGFCAITVTDAPSRSWVLAGTVM